MVVSRRIAAAMLALVGNNFEGVDEGRSASFLAQYPGSTWDGVVATALRLKARLTIVRG